MKKLTIVFPHAFTWKWTAIAVHALKKFRFPIEHEIIVVDNSMGHPSIKCLEDTWLGDGVRIISGDPNLSSHGQALSLAYDVSDSDWIFTSESDALPIVDSWGNEYIKAAADYDYMGPYMALAGGKFIHPCGSMSHRKVIEAAKEWRKHYDNWMFITGAAQDLGLSDKAYHVSCTKGFYEKWMRDSNLGGTHKIFQLNTIAEIWSKAGPWQEMLSFTDDSFDNYWMRENPNLSAPHKDAYLRIGYEPGQWLSAFALKNFKCLMAPYQMQWVPGFTNRQAAYSDVFGVFRHCWCGTSSFSPAIDPAIRDFKMNQMEMLFSQLPVDLKKQIIKLEESHQP